MSADKRFYFGGVNMIKLFSVKGKKDKKESFQSIQNDLDQITQMLLVNGQQMTEHYRDTEENKK